MPSRGVDKWVRSAWADLRQRDRSVRAWMRSHGPTVLRVALGLVFLWFGLLKVFGVSPAAQMVADTLSWLPRDVAVLAIGSLEVVLGLALLVFAIALRVAVAVQWAHLLERSWSSFSCRIWSSVPETHSC